MRSRPGWAKPASVDDVTPREAGWLARCFCVGSLTLAALVLVFLGDWRGDLTDTELLRVVVLLLLALVIKP